MPGQFKNASWKAWENHERSHKSHNLDCEYHFSTCSIVKYFFLKELLSVSQITVKIGMYLSKSMESMNLLQFFISK